MVSKEAYRRALIVARSHLDQISIHCKGKELSAFFVLAEKTFRHCASVSQLSDGARIFNGDETTLLPFSFIDSSSANVVARAALETVSILNFLYLDQDSVGKDVQLFRILCREYALLKHEIAIERFFAPEKQSEKDRLILGDMESRINKFVEAIELKKEFAELSDRVQQKLLRNGDWMSGLHYTHLIHKLGMKSDTARFIYSSLSSDTHAGPMSTKFLSMEVMFRMHFDHSEFPLFAGFLAMSFLVEKIGKKFMGQTELKITDSDVKNRFERVRRAVN